MLKETSVMDEIKVTLNTTHALEEHPKYSSEELYVCIRDIISTRYYKYEIYFEILHTLLKWKITADVASGKPIALIVVYLRV
jgi:hypothetical protein